MVHETHPSWCSAVSTRIRTDLPRIQHDAVCRVETESRRIVYLGHPYHLNRKTGTLQGSLSTLTVQTDDTVISSVGTSVPYAAVHELGGTVVHCNGTISVIPSRPYLVPAARTMKDSVLSQIVSDLVADIREECR